LNWERFIKIRHKILIRLNTKFDLFAENIELGIFKIRNSAKNKLYVGTETASGVRLTDRCEAVRFNSLLGAKEGVVWKLHFFRLPL